ncbi:MAG: D-Ala-D-Ala carboxypeptidase family metallohydrolase [Gemmatimonadaceae bacterium]
MTAPATKTVTKLSENFSLEEFAVSGSHPELVQPVPIRYQANVRRLVETILQPLRSLWGKRFRILSGYRDATLNGAVGGSSTSQHRRAEASDVTTENVRGLVRAMIVRPNKFPTGQVIYYPSQNFAHIALPSARYEVPTFFVCTGPKQYELVRNAADFDRVVARVTGVR